MPVELRKVRSLFERTLKIRDSRFLLREVAHRMNERLSVMKIEPRRVLDAGCGEGFDLQKLTGQFPEACIVGLDASWPLLREARNQLQSWEQKPDFVCGDFGRSPFLTGSFDVIWSNLALHWYEENETVFKEWKRILTENGLVLFSSFGPETFANLKKAFEQVDRYAHVLSFPDMRDLGDRLVTAGFAAPVLEREWIDVTYRDVLKLLADVRAFGGNPLSGSRKGLLGKFQYEKLLAALNVQRDDANQLTLRFEIIYGHAFKEERTELRENVIGFYG